ncbi:YhhN-like protein-domain-containing protein [Crucibulum laeve]|uniref:YhhN-like protein-domain-containing protein n=1 Tax=Crucibulum laeve TaxID=68775 RepID=A0A5C3M5S7_9AGAR|nr:YhhN-like protein-domain-containing protein [Crucibulum laeve]
MALSLPPTLYLLLLTASLSLLTLSEARSFYAGSAGFKVLASLSFLGGGLALASSKFTIWTWDAWTAENRYPITLITGLAFGLVGDVLLIPSKQSYFERAISKSEGDSLWFKAGTLSFALTHISYIVAFLSTASWEAFRLPDFALSLAFCLGLTHWLGFLGGKPKAGAMSVPDDMKFLVRAYVSIIVTMVSVATATDDGWQRTVGAWMFMVSDLFVAMDTFGPRKAFSKTKVRPGWKARSVGWLAYFWAQMLLAGCI